MNTLTVGIARTPEEARQCFALRYAAHVTDGKRSHYLDHRAREVRDELDEIATIHTVSDGDRIIATMRSVWGGDACPSAIGTGSIWTTSANSTGARSPSLPG
ncbi:hypothetical protein [Nevskia ramosa]|uniref:hypothetical protein n=1 Tax=Nevskia ramosa TaxID=64002 RepID=UPI003D0984C9